MAKKKREEVVEEPRVGSTGGAEPEVVQETCVEQKPNRVVPKNKTLSEGWELKNRIYRLKGSKKPLSRSVKSANIHYFDEEKGYERELKYCSNQKTCFVDEMKGDQRMEHIVFRNGMRILEKEKVVFKKLLSLYHPDRNKIF